MARDRRTGRARALVSRRGRLDPEAGEVFEADGGAGKVTKLEEPHLIEWTFDDQVFRFELRPEQHGCALVFTHIFDNRSIAAQTAAGWDCYFDRLDAQLAGGDLDEETAHQPIGERHERYAAQFGVEPTPGREFIANLDFRGLTLEEGPVLRLERRYDHSAERVWRALIDPTERGHWFPGELTITESDPPRLLVGSWQGEGTLRFELRAEGEGCVLVFTHAFTDRDQATLAGAGWDRCFARLEALLAEHPLSEAASFTEWQTVHERLASAWNIDPSLGRAAYAEHPVHKHQHPAARTLR